jgi:subtilisin family serine protease
MGVVGVAPRATIVSVRVLPDDDEPGLSRYHAGLAYAGAVGMGVYYAVRHGARVINLSLGSQRPSGYQRAAIAYAISHGVVVVASAGNSGTSGSFAPYVYPASFTGVIAVAAVTASGARAPFSEQNSSVVISAPGVNVVGAGPKGQYTRADGTSPAAAIVSGVAALILARYPGLSPALVEQAIVSSASQPPAGGYSVRAGFGEVNAAAALAAAAAIAHEGTGAFDRRTPSGVDIASVPDVAGPGTRLARSPAPIVVTHRDMVRVVAWAAASTLAAAGAAIALAALVVFARRPRPRQPDQELASMPPGDDLIG